MMGRAVSALLTMIRGFLQRNGPTPLFLLAIAAAALAYTIRAARQKRSPPSSSPSSPGRAGAGGGDATTPRSARALIDASATSSAAAPAALASLSSRASRAPNPAAVASSGGVVAPSSSSGATAKRSGAAVSGSGKGAKGLIKLAHVQSMTVGCCLDDGSLFTYDRASGLCELHTAAVEALDKLVGAFDVYMIVRIDSDEEEELVRRAFEAVSLFSTGAAYHKLLFCETLLGRASIVRQFEPDLHMDSSTIVTDSLYRFIRYTAVFGPNHDQDLGAASSKAPNLFRYPSFKDLLQP